MRFWHILVGNPDFAIGGSRYAQVRKSLSRNSRANRKLPVNLDMMTHIVGNQNDANPQSAGIGRSALVGFFFLLRVGDLEGLSWAGVSISTDFEGVRDCGPFPPDAKRTYITKGTPKRPRGETAPVSCTRVCSDVEPSKNRGRG